PSAPAQRPATLFHIARHLRPNTERRIFAPHCTPCPRPRGVGKSGMLRRAALGLVLSTALACGRGSAPPATARNLVLVTIDTLRADRVGAYGSRDVATPHLDQLAREGAFFPEAAGAVPLTRGAPPRPRSLRSRAAGHRVASPRPEDPDARHDPQGGRVRDGGLRLR